jgi:serine acetyltransferase
MNTLILSGIHVGDGAIIGAYSVVTKDVEPYTIVAGNPAKVIRKRFDQETIDALLRIKWWNWDIHKIKDSMPLLLSNRFKEFIDANTA